MPKKLKLILDSIDSNPDDDLKAKDWVTHYLEIPELWDEEHDFKLLKDFLKDTLEQYSTEIEYDKKYVDVVYDENGYRFLEFVSEFYKKILDKLESK